MQTTLFHKVFYITYRHQTKSFCKLNHHLFDILFQDSIQNCQIFRTIQSTYMLRYLVPQQTTGLWNNQLDWLQWIYNRIWFKINQAFIKNAWRKALCISFVHINKRLITISLWIHMSNRMRRFATASATVNTFFYYSEL